MAIIVQKFGGTSVGSPERIEAVAEQIIKTRAQGHQVVVILSAMSGETNRLTDLATQIDPTPSGRELDMLLSSGEQVSIALLAIALIKRGHSAVSLLAHQVGINTNNRFNKARILSIDNTRMLIELQQGHVVIVAGFQGQDHEGNITTLGRGGSDTSAVAIATALQAKECQIFTDVDGVYTTDPRIDKNAKKLARLTFEEMLEMASSGAKVLHSRSVEYAGKFKMPLRVLSSFEPGEGTQIDFLHDPQVDHPVTAITAQRDEVFVEITYPKFNSDFYIQLFKALAKADIEVDMLSQHQMGSKAFLSFTIARADLTLCDQCLTQIMDNNLDIDVNIHTSLAKISAIGNGMRSHTGVLSTFTSTLNEHGVEMLNFANAQIKISALVHDKDVEKAVQVLHNRFKLG
ncbi:aspartate kinase [Thalassotalea aquiviva]|uniref:aspartate kinase n=1 Tax=Thalassotalea aquiviva TaxID=3242415 RepID=UPI00352AC972